MFRTLIATLLAVFALNALAADANQASRAELETVKGIGPGLSGKIIKAREASPFKNWGDLVERVGGIGAGNAGKLSQAGLTVAGSAYDATTAAPAKASKTAKAGKDSSKEGSPAKRAKKASEAA